jgi:butyryl-CoA dehydrogenase
MDFELTEEQGLIRNMVREFAENEVRPIAAEIDKNHRWPEETIARMRELDIMGLSVPETYGGSGGGTISYSLAIEELSRVCASHGAILAVHIGAINAIRLFGKEEQKRKFIPEMASGKRIACLCMTEPGAGTDASAQRTRAVRDGNRYVINGGKIFITNGPVGGTYVVLCMTDPDKGIKGISAFIVNRETPGLKIGQIEDKLGIRGSVTSEVFFEDMAVPAENLLGGEGQGFKVVMKTLDIGRIGMASQAVGIAQGALEAAVAYIKDRKQFGRPIAANQGIQWMVAEMAAKIEAARLLTRRAAVLCDQQERISVEAAMAKLTAASAAMDVTVAAIQLHGGIGYTTHHPVERFMRDAKITEIYEGTSEVMKMVIAGSVLA